MKTPGTEDTIVEENDDAGLGTISEAAEDMEEDSQMSDGNSQSQTSLSRSRSVSQAGGGFDDGVGNDDDDWDREDVDDDDDEDDDHDDDRMESPSQDDDEDRADIGTTISKPEYQPCAEDDDFLAALDKMVNENIAEHKNLVRDKNAGSAMTVPVGGGKSKKNWEQLQNEDESAREGVQVQLMLRKPGKGGTSTKSINVACDSMLGEQFLAREERELKERERMKQLTLEISERQEQEELSEALHQLQRVTLGGSNNQKYRHNKGAPDADLIFGKKH